MNREELRTCIVATTDTEGKKEQHKAYFHRWHENRLGNSCMLYGIVEYEDGSIHGAIPGEITFTDRETIQINKSLIVEGDICEFGKNEKVFVYVSLGRGSSDSKGAIEGFYLTGKNKGHIGAFYLKELRKTDKHFDIDNILKNVCAE